MKFYLGDKESRSATDYKFVDNAYFWLLLILVIGFLVRFWILDERWINPDEGAHLIDGRLVLDGLVPKVDYGSRQPLYVYIIALVLELFGISYIKARFFLALIPSIGVALLIFLISKKLFNNRVALLSSALYVFLPLSIMESTIVKTEPLTTLLCCIALYFTIIGTGNERRSGLFFFLSGVFLSIAYYVRESSLSILPAIFLFFMVVYWGAFRKLFKSYLFVLTGYLSVCLLVFAYYSQYLTLNQLLASPMNPSNIILRSLEWFFSVKEAVAAVSGGGDFDFTHQSRGETVYYLSLTLFSNSFLFVGLILSAFILVFSLSTRTNRDDFYRGILLPFALLYSWILSLTLGYTYWTLNRGYYIQYFEEFLPPLSILLAFVILYIVPWLKPKTRDSLNVASFVFISVTVLITVFFANRVFAGFRVKSEFYFLFAILLLSFVYPSPGHGIRRATYVLLAIGGVSAVLLNLISDMHPAIRVPLDVLLFVAVYYSAFRVTRINFEGDLKAGLGFILVSFILFSFLFSFAVSGRNMGVDFDCVWSPETVREVSDYMKENSSGNDQVISGGVIWEFQSGGRPFMNQTHPLAYSLGIPPQILQNIERHLATQPPRFIVLDGYTEKTYLNQVDKLRVIMDEEYILRKVVEGSRYPVMIYELNQDIPG